MSVASPLQTVGMILSLVGLACLLISFVKFGGRKRLPKNAWLGLAIFTGGYLAALLYKFEGNDEIFLISCFVSFAGSLVFGLSVIHFRDT